MIGKAEMITPDGTHVATHCHAAHMNAPADAADVCATSETAHVSAPTESSAVAATAETAAVTAATSAASAPRIRCADSQCGGKSGRGQDHHHSFHQNTPCI
ncbi:hypothetical protein [Bradyrhizobium sp. S3.3.6]|uniref:hypothetical protein n=1 Tax=Bradyrhizobium sp. S3.3.6 TaxID=3156429 RepID=UPI00339B36AB